MKREMLITHEDAFFIVGDSINLDQRVECEKCGQKECDVKKFKYYLNDIGDIAIRGECESCGEPISIYIESGANYQNFIRANQIMMKKLQANQS